MKTKVNIILGSLVGLLFVWLAFRGTDIEGLKSSSGLPLEAQILKA